MPFIGFASSQMVAGGIFLEGDVEIQDIYATLEAPPNYTIEGQVFVKAELKLLTGDQEMIEHWWSLGKESSKEIVPGDDEGKPVNQGYHLVPVSEDTSPSLKSSSNWGMMALSLETAKFPKDKLESGNFRDLKGLQIHAKTIYPERTGLAREEGKRPLGTLVCERIIKLPGEKAPAKAGRTKAATTAAVPAASVAAAAAPAPAADVDVDTLAVESFRKLIADAKGPVDLNAARGQLFRAMQKTHPPEIRNRVIQKLADEEWLVTNGFAVEGGSLARLG